MPPLKGLTCPALPLPTAFAVGQTISALTGLASQEYVSELMKRCAKAGFIGRQSKIDTRQSATQYHLFLEVLRSFGAARLAVTGTSMLSSIWPGDILEVCTQRRRTDQPCDSEEVAAEFATSSAGGTRAAFEGLKEQQIPRPARNDSGGGVAIFPGEIVLYARGGGVVAHRVVRLIRKPGRTLLITRGDRLRQPDLPVAPEDVLGRVTAIVRGGHRITPRLTCWGRIASWVLSRSDLATRVVLRLSKAMWMRSVRDEG